MNKTQPVNKDSLLYNSRNLNVYLKLIRNKYSYINIPEFLQYAGMELHEVEDEGHWFSQEQINRFYYRLVQLTGNKNIAREAGRYAASPDALGAIKKYILGFVGPDTAYRLIDQYAPLFTRSSYYKSKKIGHNKIEITVIPYEGVKEEKYQCENRLGYLEAISQVFNHRLPKIEHPECMFNGSNRCRYMVSWQDFRSSLWKKIRNISIFSIAILNLFLYNVNPELALAYTLPISIIILLGISLWASYLEKDELNEAINNLRSSVEELLGNIDINYNNALLINEIGFSLNKQMNVPDIVNNTVSILQKRLDYDRGAIFLTNTEKSYLYFQGGFGYTDEQYDILRKNLFRLDKPDSKGVFVVSFREKKPLLINDIEDIKDNLSPHSYEFAKKMGTRSFICCPIVYENESLGILAVDNIKTKRPLKQSDLSLLMGIANAVGVSIRNSILSDAKIKQFNSILQVLSASIDARDFLTSGHSIRVTEFAVGICKEMGLSHEYTEMIRIAALLHDYGKIGIDDSILKKNGKLTSEEYKEIQTHAEKTYKILKQIGFEGIYKEIPDIAGSHHEKLDGSGYPNGLKGDKIPLGARIIAVADFFEAITSKRHYRDAMPLDQAIALLIEKRGVHFDEAVVDAFLNYYSKSIKFKNEKNAYSNGFLPQQSITGV
jgi:HD-GYP domain-containing protein (c-di-GMP phosphodiesterase class II)